MGLRSRLIALFGAALALSVVTAAQSSRPTIAILNFDYGTIEHWWQGNYDVGAGVADLLVDQLLDDGSFRIIERKKLDAILAEQNFSNSERADPSAKTVAQIGKVLGVKYLVVGSITKFGTENSNKSVSGGAVTGRFGIGKVGKSEGKANVALTARMIDVTTSEIMLSAKGDGTSKRSGMLLGGAGGGPGGMAGGALDFRSSNFKDTIIGEATDAAVKTLGTAIVAKKDRLN
jgi:curli biogenesis system outer membrane secretion channel CsgG